MFYIYLSEVTPLAHAENYVRCSVKVGVIAQKFSLVYVIVD